MSMHKCASTTGDLGMLIASHIDGKVIIDREDNRPADLDASVDYVDASDPSNLVVVTDAGERFQVRIVRMP